MSAPLTPDVTPDVHPGRVAVRPGARVTLGEAVSLGVLLLLVVAAVFPALFTPYDPLAINPSEAFGAPSFSHPFGTDESGRDIFSRVIHGSSSSLLIGVSATAIGIGLALVLGVLGGLGARPLDFAVTRVNEVLFALPGLLLALVFIAIAGPGVLTTTVAVGLSTAPGYARIIRSQVRAVRGSAYVEAATVLGRSRFTILRRHILPNAVAPVFVLATLGVGQAIVWASSLSYLGLGAVPPAAEWGSMLSVGRTYINVAWWMTVFPGLFIVLAAASATALGRSLQARTREGGRPVRLRRSRR
jgi:peptide/nickel transport system permease protein